MARTIENIIADAAVLERLRELKVALWAVDDALNRARVTQEYPTLTRMGRIAALADHRNRLMNRCRAAGLPTD